MLRIIIGIVIIVSAAVYVRQQYRTVVTQITARPPAPGAKQHDGWRKCVICGGSGRTRYWDASGEAQSDNCTSCNGTGWVADPFGKAK